jgi:hypothetical protein
LYIKLAAKNRKILDKQYKVYSVIYVLKRIFMLKKIKAAKALALVAVCIGSGQLFAAPTPPTPPKAPGTGASAPTGGSGTGAAAPIGFQSVGSSYATQPTLMATDFQTAMGLIGAVTAEAAESMGSGAGSANTADSGIKLAGASGSNHRASAWARASFTAIDNATKDQQWNAKVGTYMVGTDYKFNKMFCAGLALLYRNLDGRTEFNNGTMKQDTMGVNPYLLIVPHKNFNFELVGGWNTTKGKDTRHWKTFAPAGGFGGVAAGGAIDGKYTASPKSQNLFGGVFANFVNKVNKTSFSLQVGYAMMQSKTKKYTEKSQNSGTVYTDNAMSQAGATFKAQTVTGKALVLYQMTPSVAPFVHIHGLYDVKKNEGVKFATGKSYTAGRSAFGGGGGFHVRNDDALSGSLQFDYTKRSQLSTYVTALRLHYGF